MEPTRLKDLIRLFAVLKDLHGQLASLVQLKIDAMKRSDLTLMAKFSEREQAIVRRLEEREGLRRQLMDSIGGELGLKPRAARAMTVTQLAASLPESSKSDLVASAKALRAVVASVARVNRVASEITRGIAGHLKWVFASVRPKDEGQSGYGAGGTATRTADLRIFEAVG